MDELNQNTNGETTPQSTNPAQAGTGAPPPVTQPAKQPPPPAFPTPPTIISAPSNGGTPYTVPPYQAAPYAPMPTAEEQQKGRKRDKALAGALIAAVAAFTLLLLGTLVYIMTTNVKHDRLVHSMEEKFLDAMYELNVAEDSLYDANDTIDALQKENEELANQNRILQNELKIAQVPRSGDDVKGSSEADDVLASMAFINAEEFFDFDGMLYHTYDCPNLDTRYYMAMSEKVMKLETDFEPCPTCH